MGKIPKWFVSHCIWGKAIFFRLSMIVWKYINHSSRAVEMLTSNELKELRGKYWYHLFQSLYFSNLRLIMINLCREALKTVPNHPSSKLVRYEPRSSFCWWLIKWFWFSVGPSYLWWENLKQSCECVFLGVMAYGVQVHWSTSTKLTSYWWPCWST